MISTAMEVAGYLLGCHLHTDMFICIRKPTQNFFTCTSSYELVQAKKVQKSPKKVEKKLKKFCADFLMCTVSMLSWVHGVNSRMPSGHLSEIQREKVTRVFLPNVVSVWCLPVSVLLGECVIMTCIW
jgi:hypothetical protein